MKNNLRAQKPLIYHKEVPTALYEEYYPPTSGQKRMSYRKDKPM